MVEEIKQKRKFILFLYFFQYLIIFLLYYYFDWSVSSLLDRKLVESGSLSIHIGEYVIKKEKKLWSFLQPFERNLNCDY